jgi:hypothetical protein
MSAIMFHGLSFSIKKNLGISAFVILYLCCVAATYPARGAQLPFVGLKVR